MNPLRLEQLSEYTQAIYEVDIDGGWVDASKLPLDGNTLPAALISACNPHSQLLPECENVHRHEHLQREIETGGYRWWPARGRSADAAWVEPGFLVLAPLAQIDAWARAFGQHAVWLAPRSGCAASLRVYSRFDGARPPARLGGMDIEWGLAAT